jgi:hypothetical protein
VVGTTSDTCGRRISVLSRSTGRRLRAACSLSMNTRIRPRSTLSGFERACSARTGEFRRSGPFPTIDTIRTGRRHDSKLHAYCCNSSVWRSRLDITLACDDSTVRSPNRHDFYPFGIVARGASGRRHRRRPPFVARSSHCSVPFVARAVTATYGVRSGHEPNGAFGPRCRRLRRIVPRHVVPSLSDVRRCRTKVAIRAVGQCVVVHGRGR